MTFLDMTICSDNLLGLDISRARDLLTKRGLLDDFYLITNFDRFPNNIFNRCG